MTGENKNGGSDGKWNVTKDKILLFSGLAFLTYIIVGVTSFHQEFHPEFLLVIGGMFGLAAATWGDRK